MIALVRNTKKITLFLSDACNAGSELSIHKMYLAIRMSAMRAGWGRQEGETLKRAPIAFSRPLISPTKIPACHGG